MASHKTGSPKLKLASPSTSAAGEAWTATPPEAVGDAPVSREAPEAPSSIDRLMNAAMARLTLSISPASLALAYFDWALHFAVSPGKQEALFEKALRKATRFGVHAMRSVAAPETPPCIEPLPQDRPIRPSGMAASPVRLHLPRVSSEPAMVAQRDDRRARRVAPP